MSKSTPLVSVLMPVYNVAEYIAESIGSVLNQTFTNFELLIIDDCTPDNSIEIAESFHDSRIRIIHNPKNLGLYKTLNHGIAEAKGIYLARLDPDDIAYPNRLELQVKAFEQDSELAMVAGRTETISANGTSQGMGKWHFTPEMLYYNNFFRNCLTHSSVMFKKEIVEKLGYYQQQYAEDYDLWSRMTMRYKVTQLDFPVVKYRVHEKGLIGTVGDKYQEAAYTFAENRLEEVTGKRPSRHFIQVASNWQLLANLSHKELISFATEYPATLAAILAAAPSYCDHKALTNYIADEWVKYHFFLKEKRMTMLKPAGLTISLRNLVYGWLLYRSHCRFTTYLDRVLVHSHF